MKEIAPEQISQFNADFVKIFTSGLGLGLVIRDTPIAIRFSGALVCLCSS